jgi:hypothetical protein
MIYNADENFNRLLKIFLTWIAVLCIFYIAEKDPMQMMPFRSYMYLYFFS